jgi:hypothetical protein
MMHDKISKELSFSWAISLIVPEKKLFHGTQKFIYVFKESIMGMKLLKLNPFCSESEYSSPSAEVF